MANNQSSLTRFPPGYFEEYNGQVPLSAGVAFIVLVVFCVILRFCARYIGKVAWGADDTLIIIGTILCLATIGCCLGALHYGGAGYHWAVFEISSHSTLVAWAKYSLIIPMLAGPAAAFPKLAILHMYLRIFPNRKYRIACWVIGAITITGTVAFVGAGFFICIPLNFLWNKTIPGGHCFNINSWYRWSHVPTIFTDIVMLILPMPVIWRIQISKKARLGLVLSFAAGSSGLIVAIIRLKGFFASDFSQDGTWTASRLLTLTIVENGMYVIAACLPTYRPLALLFWTKRPPRPRSLPFVAGAHQPRQHRSELDTGELLSESYQLNGST